MIVREQTNSDTRKGTIDNKTEGYRLRLNNIPDP
jgi:hypothetical protein